MQAALITGPQTLEIGEIPRPKLGAHDVEVRTAYVGVCGTDVHLYEGNSYFLDHGFQTYPFTFGHEYSGTVSAVGSEVQEIKVGDRVVGHTMVPCGTCDRCQQGRGNQCRSLSEVGLRHIQGAAAEYVTVPHTAVTPLPEHLSLRAAPLIEPGVTAFSACRRTNIAPSDRVAILGTGTLGLLTGLFAKLSSPQVDVLGIAESELDFARTLGFHNVLHVDDAPRNAYDVVMETSGAAIGFALATDLADSGARIGLVGLTVKGSRDVDQEKIALKDLSIFGILHGLNHYREVAALYASGAIDPTQLIAEVMKPSEAVRAFQATAGGVARTQPKYLLEFAGEQR